MSDLVFEVGTALVLVAAVSVIASKLKLSNIPFLIILGMLLGPYAPVIGIFDFTFAASQEVIDFLGKMGVLFLLFYLGLEFSVPKLISMGDKIFFGGTVYILLNFLSGLGFGFLTGFGLYETLIIAGMMSVSSTAMVAKILIDLRRTGNSETELILGMILFDDLFLAIFLSIMSGILLGGATSIGGIIISSLISFGYMLLFFLIARKGTPILNKIFNISSNEIFVIIIFALLFFVAGFSEHLHVAEAIGALLFGLALSETDHVKRIAQNVVPFRDFFGAVFFFSFGLSIDLSTLGDALWIALGGAAITMFINLLSGYIAGHRAKINPKGATNIGLTIMVRGEFTIIVANMGVAAGLSPLIKSYAALYVLVLAIVGPLAAKESKYIYAGLNKIFRWHKPNKSVSIKNNGE